MAREEIVAGLKNAVLRGESLEKAVQSMISAGYSNDEVREAARYINMGAIGAVQAGISAETLGRETSTSGEFIDGAKKKKKTGLIVLLVVILLLIIGGIAVSVLFGDKILSALFP